ncbi:hypothetical protein CW685_08465 [Macrococcoides caseolyticum]|nr:hypothetical protein CW685_08465 [Macrococcus caseolyticus]PNZ71400.1 hypothetical protein CD152_09795 [Macrococcus caseolyticus]
MQEQLVERSDPLQSSVSRTSALADSDTVLLDCRMINRNNPKHVSVCSIIYHENIFIRKTVVS